jgi:hypothetical protein
LISGFNTQIVNKLAGATKEEVLIMNLIMGLVGMATLILIAVLFSSNRKAIKIRTVGGALPSRPVWGLRALRAGRS